MFMLSNPIVTVPSLNTVEGLNLRKAAQIGLADQEQLFGLTLGRNFCTCKIASML